MRQDLRKPQLCSWRIFLQKVGGQKGPLIPMVACIFIIESHGTISCLHASQRKYRRDVLSVCVCAARPWMKELPKIRKEDRCGYCHTCLNPHLKKPCKTRRDEVSTPPPSHSSSRSSPSSSCTYSWQPYVLPLSQPPGTMLAAFIQEHMRAAACTQLSIVTIHMVLSAC